MISDRITGVAALTGAAASVALLFLFASIGWI